MIIKLIAPSGALGIWRLSAHLRETDQIKVDCLGVSTGVSSFFEALNDCVRSHSDIVGLSCFMWNINQQLKLARAVKSCLPQAKIILGGPEATARFEEILDEHQNVDAVVLGEGEVTFGNLVRTMLGTNQLVADDSQCPAGVACRDSTGQVEFASEVLIEKLDDLASPILDGNYLECQERGTQVLWEIARGCPFRCKYCYEGRGHKGIRYHSLSRLKAELKKICALEKQIVWGLLPTFNANVAMAKKLLEIIQKYNVNKLQFWFEGKIDIVDEELLEMIRGDPNVIMTFGIQSLNPAALKAIDRPLNWEKAIKTASILSLDRVPTLRLDLIFGLPGDGSAEIRKNLDECIALCPHRLQLFRLLVLPGTRLRFEADHYGILYENRPPYSVWSTPKLSAVEIGHWEMFSRFLRFWNTTRFMAFLSGILNSYGIRPTKLLESCLEQILISDDDDFKAWVMAEGLQKPGGELDDFYLGQNMDKLQSVYDCMRDLLKQCLVAKLPDLEVQKHVLELYRFCCDQYRFTIKHVTSEKADEIRETETDPTEESVLRLRFPVVRYDVDLRRWEFERNSPMKEVVKETATTFVMFVRLTINVLEEIAAKWYSRFEVPKSFDTALAEFRETDSLNEKEVEALKGLVWEGVAKGILTVEAGTKS